MGVTVLTQNAFAPPADPLNNSYVMLGFGVPPFVGPGPYGQAPSLTGVSVIQVGSKTYSPCVNFQNAVWIGYWPGLPTNALGHPGFSGLTTSPNEALLQGYLDANGNFQQLQVTYSNRTTFPGGSLPICLYRTDAVARIVELDDYRTVGNFPGAVSAKGMRTI